MKERWLPIKGYEGHYEVSDFGRIRTLKYGAPCGRRDGIMSIIDHGNGYRYVTLMKNGIRKNYYVHRLVAEAFLPNPKHCEEVNHIDYNKANNELTNLEWCTRIENMRHSNIHMHYRRPRTTNTGYVYISKNKKGYYRVIIDLKERTFKNLEKAIDYRNEVIHENINNGRLGREDVRRLRAAAESANSSCVRRNCKQTPIG